MIEKTPKKSTSNPAQDALSHSRDLLLALSRAAQSIQRARTAEEVYHAVGDQIKTLGGEVSMFMLNDDRQSLTMVHASYKPNVIQRFEKLTGHSATGYRFALAPDSIAAGRVVHAQWTRKYADSALKKTPDLLIDQLMSILKIRRGILAPLRVDDEPLGLIIVSGLSLNEDDLPAMESFAGQIAVSLSNVRLTQQIQNEFYEHKQAEGKLRESEVWLRALFEQMAVGVAQIQTHTGKFIQINQKYCDIVGYSHQEMKSLDFRSISHPDDLQADLENMEQLMSDAIQEFTLEKRYIHKNGSTVWVELTISSMWQAGAVPDFHIAIVQDITARKQAEENSHLQSAALEAAANAIAITDKKGTIQWVNPAWTKLTGYSKEESIGRNARIIKSEKHDAAFYKNMWDTILEGKVWRGELINKRKNGNLYYEEETITPVLNKRGEVTNFIGIKQDITERKQSEEALEHAKETLEMMNLELRFAFEHEQHLAHTDVLTGVYSRRYLFERAEHEFEVARRYKQPLSVIMFDLDHFKNINDTFGHAVGDLMLERVTHVANSQLRDVDLIGRYGGEEFVIVLPVTSAQQAYLLAERIRTSAAALHVETGSDQAVVTLSVGIAEMLHKPQDGSVENVIRRADEAMYAAKQAGRNRTMIFDPDATGAI